MTTKIKEISKMTLEEALQEAQLKVLPFGLKPEDYMSVSGTQELPLRIAKMIVTEAMHIMQMSKAREAFKNKKRKA